MTRRILIVASNDVGFRDMEELRQQGLHAANAELGYSGGAIRKLHDEQIDVQVVKLDSAIQAVETRLSLSLRVDGVCLMSCRPYGDSRELIDPARKIRSLPDHLECFPGVYAKTIPVVLSDLKSSLGGRPMKRPGGDWISIVEPQRGSADLGVLLRAGSERAYELSFQAMRDWSIHLMEDLETSGLILHRNVDGSLVARLALRRKLHGGRMHSPEFHPGTAHAAGLPIFALDIDVDREPFLGLQDLLTGELYRRYARMDRTKPEILLHRMLDLNPGIVARETHEVFRSEIAFQIRNGLRQSMRPDLILRPIKCEKAMLLMELKLPSAPTVIRKAGEPTFGRSVFRAANQVRQYARSILDPANAEEVERRLDFVPERMDLAIVIGLRRPDEPAGLVEDLRVRHDLVDVHVVRYNELSEYGLKLWGKESPILRPW